MIKEKSNAFQNTKKDEYIKYIVEAPKPKKGQKASSGGIREKGRLASQFKNPIILKESMPSQPISIHSPATNLAKENQRSVLRNKTINYLLNIIWQEFGDPILRSGLQKLREPIISKIESSFNPCIHQVSLTEMKGLGEEAQGEDNYCNKKKIIYFDQKRKVM